MTDFFCIIVIALLIGLLPVIRNMLVTPISKLSLRIGKKFKLEIKFQTKGIE